MQWLKASKLALVLLVAPLGLRAETPDETTALIADKAWLVLVDAGDYQDAWNSTDKSMQTALPEEALAKAIDKARGPLGKVIERSLKHVQSATQLPGVPDGHYVVVQFSTHFANKAEGIETVISSQGGDGTWRVAGYFVR